MDLKLRFESFFGKSEEANELWLTLDEVYSADINSYHNWSFVADSLERFDKEDVSGFDTDIIESLLWLSPAINSTSYLKFNRDSFRVISKGALEVIKVGNSSELEICNDIQNLYFIEDFESSWKKTQEKEYEAILKDKEYQIYKSLRKRLKAVIKGEHFFTSEYCRTRYGFSVLENAKLTFERISLILKYKPRPHDTSSVHLPEDLFELLEDMAENIHENWSALRVSQGWRYGTERNGKRLTHPCLIPYDLLPDIEKGYDRKTSQETLKFILAKDYKILPPEREVVFERLSSEALKNLNVRELLNVQRRLKNEINSDPNDFLVLGQAFQQLAEKVLSYETFQIGIKRLGGDKKSQLYRDMTFNAARSLADCYAYKEAEKLLRELYDKGFTDGYVTGQLAKIRKTLAMKLGDQENLNEALSYYKRGYDTALEQMTVQAKLSDLWYAAVDQAIYNGINTATMYMLKHNKELCNKTAGEVLELCSAKETDKISYWDQASMGEACLLDGNLVDSAKYYSEAAAEAPPGDIESMITQIRAICAYLNIETKWISDVFVVPAAVIFSGHAIDREGEQRFPESDELRVTEEIRCFLQKEKPGFAYCSATPGSEIIFIEQMLEMGAEVHIYLPYEVASFQKLFDEYDPSWLERFNNILDKVSSITVTGTFDEGLNDANRQFNNKYMAGLARLKSESSNCTLKALTLWDGVVDSNSDCVPGAVSIWNEIGINYEQIKTQGTKSRQVSSSLRFPETKVEESLCMLFADVKGYSKLAGEQLILFTNQFMGKSDKIISEYDDEVVIRRSMGDGLFIVFKSIEAAIAVSVGLKEMVLETDWESLGLPGDLTARFALDSGPCYSFTDPIARQFDLSGAHVIRAARLEPVTPPGHIFASEGFAAICALNNLQDHFELAGQVKLPKSYGEMRVYYLDKR